ncbi:MAG: hypothetical protein RL417_2247, partial [Pseudomonadota bacterium]
MIPSPSEHPRRPTSKDAGPILDTDDLAQATISSPSLGVIKERYAPAELTLQEVSLPDACRVINEVLAPDEDLPLEPNHLRRFLTRTALGDPLKCEELAELAPQFGDLIIRQIVTLSGADRKLIDRPSLEFSLEHPVSDGCAVTISPGKRPDTCELTLDWERELDYQSNYSLSERWEVIEEILLVAGEIDSASCKTRAIDPIGPRFQLEERATIEVVARDLASADPALDPHLSQRSDLLPLCALRLIDPEVESIYDLKERILHVHAQLSKISPNLPNEIDLDAAMVSRSQLEQLGDAPFIWNSSADMAIITVEHYVLVVTKASTGLTLLEDVQALEGYARRTRDGEIRPEIARLKSIQSASPSEEALAEIFKTFNLPSGWYFFGAMQAFVESDDHDARGRIKDGLLDAITSGNPATVELTRDYRIQGDDLDEFEDDSP